MKVLLVGGGGREHALAWKMASSPLVDELYAAPGNPGIAQYAQCLPIGVMEFDAIVKFVKEKKIGLVVIGPEDPLAAGLADRIIAAGAKVFGPSASAARVEGDKWFAKELMRHQAVPTAEARSFTDPASAEEYVRKRNGPCVIKAAGLAAGKGVSICYRAQDGIQAVRNIMLDRAFGAAGDRVLIEEMLSGPECSLLAFVDRRSVYIMETAQDHKPVDEGDTGPMTGGMGAYSPTPVVTDAMLRTIERDIIIPVIDGLWRHNIEYKGVLYAGLMITPNGPKVLEFNCRFGDPETQPLMMRLQTDIVEIMLAVADGKLDQLSITWDQRPAISVVAASRGYPGNYPKGLPITGIEAADAMPDVKVFHAGTAMEDGKLVTAGGRVLAVTAMGNDIRDAHAKAYAALEKIHFEGMHYRKDIGQQAIKVK
jgi:phosphoribosylamine---glycine ligase